MTVNLWKISSTKFAVSYYGEGNYNSNRPDQFERSQWQGKGAELLGLSGRVDIESLTRVLNGDTLDGRCIGQRQGQTYKSAIRRNRTPGNDITFAPPKDVSLMYYLGRDERIQIAHENAVTKTLNWLERKTTIPNSPKDRRNCWDENRKIVVAKFNHDVSRENDPHLHTHALIINMVNDLGQWSALNSFHHFLHSAVIEFAYDRYLKRSLREFGYQLGVDSNKKEEWFISGVSRDAVDEFSSRHFQIKKKLDSQKYSNHKVMSNVERETRDSKTETPIEDLSLNWEERGQDWIPQLRDLCALAKRRVQEQMIDSCLSERLPTSEEFNHRRARFAKEFFISSPDTENEEHDPYALRRNGSERDYATRASVSYGLRCAEQFGKTITIHSVRKRACKFAVDGVTIDDIDKQIQELIEENKDSFKYDALGQKLITPNIIPEERKFRPFLDLGGKNLLPTTLLRRNEHFANVDLSPDQENAIHAILVSRNLLIGVEGYPGSGEIADSDRTSKLCNDLIEALDDKTQPVIGIITCRSATKELTSKPNFYQYETLDDNKITKLKRSNSIQNPIIIVDVTNLTASTLLLQKLEKCMKLNPKRIVLFDNLNLSKLPSTKRHAYSVLQKAGIETAIVNDIDKLKHVCEQTNTSIHQLRSAIRRIGASITVNFSSNDVLDDIFKHLKLLDHQTKPSHGLGQHYSQNHGKDSKDTQNHSNALNDMHRRPISISGNSENHIAEAQRPTNTAEETQKASTQSDAEQIDGIHRNNNDRFPSQKYVNQNEAEQSRETQRNSNTLDMSITSSSSITPFSSNLNSIDTTKNDTTTVTFSEIFKNSSKTQLSPKGLRVRSHLFSNWADRNISIVIPDPDLRDSYNQKIRQKLIELGVLGDKITLASSVSSEDKSSTVRTIQTPSENSHAAKNDPKKERADNGNLRLGTDQPNEIAKSQNTQDSVDSSESNESFVSINSMFSKHNQNYANSGLDEHISRLSTSVELANSEDRSELEDSTSNNRPNPEIYNETNLQEISFKNTDDTSSMTEETTDKNDELGDSNSVHQVTLANEDNENLTSLQTELGRESIDTTFIEDKLPSSDLESEIETAATNKSSTSLNLNELRLNEELLIKISDSPDSMNNSTPYSNAIVTEYDSKTVTLSIQDSQQVIKHDDPLLKSAEFGYASPPQSSNISTSDDVVMVLRSQDNVTPEILNLLINSSLNSENMVIFVDDREKLAESIESLCSAVVHLPTLDRSCESQFETETKLDSQVSYLHEPDSSGPVHPESLQSSDFATDKPIDFEMELGR